MTTHMPLERLASACRADGVTVFIRPGAQGKSARNFASKGYYRGCQASCAHHTGSHGTNAQADINYIDEGKGDGYVISNAYTHRSDVPTVTLIASGPTYTEGLGGPLGIIPANRGNDVTFSNEIGGGLGAGFPAGQQKAAKILHHHANRIAAEEWDWPDADIFNPNRLFSHFEWAPGRKVDPKGDASSNGWAYGYTMWNMNKFRLDVSRHNQTPQKDTDMIYLKKNERALDTRPPHQNLVNPQLAWQNGVFPKRPMTSGEIRRVVVSMQPAMHTAAEIAVTAVGHSDGFIECSGSPEVPNTSMVPFRSGQVSTGVGGVALVNGGFWIYCVGTADIIVDVRGRA